MLNDNPERLFVVPHCLASRFILLIFLTVTGSAIADEFSATGLIESNNSHNVQPLSESHIVLLASMQEKVLMSDISSPWHGASGPCGGAVEIINGSISGTGLCTFTDTTGDKFIIAWTAQSLNDKGGPKGIWAMTGGTGRYQAGTGSGAYSDIPTDDPKFSIIDLTGTFILK